jgi:asparagine synthase (glutamine-hydrolysing)
MCGILGLYDKSGINTEKFNNSLTQLSHRGPDNKTSKSLSNNLVFGHTRLAIIDLDKASNQPFNCGDNFHIIFNGEIFNYIEIRDELIKLGYNFKTKGDTEVLLNSYIEWGESCVAKFNGMWSFVIYDKLKSQIFCSRDRYGIKPFYFYSGKEGFMASSMIKPIINYFPAISKPNHLMINEFLYRGSISRHSETWYTNIYKLLPGQNMTYNFKEIRIYSYYSLNHKRIQLNFESAKKSLLNLLKSSINLRHRSDVKITSTLTSGLDSSSIVSLSHKLKESPLDTITMYSNNIDYSIIDKKDFSIEFDSNESNSLKYFKSYNIKSKKIKSNYDNYYQSLVDCIFYIESGHASPAIVAVDQLYENAKSNGCKVLLEGQGADEILGGYVTTLFFTSLKANILKPIQLLRIFLSFKKIYSFKYIFLRSFNHLISNNFFLRLKILVQKSNVSKKLFFKRSLKNKSVLNFQQLEVLPNLLLYGDALSMKNSIETRFPFLDYRLVDFCNGLPINFLIKDNKGKYILRETMKPYLPPEIIESKVKNGFNIPIYNILKNSKQIKNILYSDIGDDFFNSVKLENILDKFYSGENNNSSFIFKILTIKIWFKLNFQK